MLCGGLDSVLLRFPANQVPIRIPRQVVDLIMLVGGLGFRFTKLKESPTVAPWPTIARARVACSCFCLRESLSVVDE